MTDTRNPALTEEQKAQKAQREAQQQREKEFRERYAVYYATKYGVGRWHRIDGIDEQDELDKQAKADLKGQPSIANSNGMWKLSKPGVYSLRAQETRGRLERIRSKLVGGDCDIVLDDKGRATPLENCYTSVSFNRVYGKVLDFMATNQGLNSVVLDWDDAKHISNTRIREFMALAKERGIAVEFGPNVIRYLQSNDCSRLLQYPPKSAEMVRREMYALRDEVKQHQLANEANVLEFNERMMLSNQAIELNKQPKLPADPNAKQKELDESLFLDSADAAAKQIYLNDKAAAERNNANPNAAAQIPIPDVPVLPSDNDERKLAQLKGLETALKTVEQRLQKVEEMKAQFDNEMNDYETKLKGDFSEADKMAALLRKNTEHRKNYKTALETEAKDLQARATFLQGKVEATAPFVANLPKEHDLVQKRDAVKERATALNTSLGKLLGNDGSINAMTKRVEGLTPLVEAAKVREKQKAAPGNA